MKKEPPFSSSAATSTSGVTAEMLSSPIVDPIMSLASSSRRESIFGDGDVFQSRTSRLKREYSNDSYCDDSPSRDDEDCAYDETTKHNSQSRSQEQQQHEDEQVQEKHPYMSLYEPSLSATEDVEVHPSPQQPEERSSSSAVANQSLLSSQRINATSSTISNSVYGAKKRQKINTVAAAAAAAAIDYSDNSNNSIAENAVRSGVHEEDTRMNLDEQVAHIVATFLDDDIDDDGDSITDGQIGIHDDDDDDDDYASFVSSNGGAVIEHTDRSISNGTNGSLADPRLAKAKYTFPYDERWEMMYIRLVAYKTEHNSTMVPIKYNEDPKLGPWVVTQRAAYRKNKKHDDRKRLLNSIGFVWGSTRTTKKKRNSRFDEKWNEMYQRLVVYKIKHKDTRVPKSYKDTQLGNWVSNQRNFYKYNKISEERKQLLNSIGLAWNTMKAESNSSECDDARWKDMYQRLVAFKAEHNHTQVTQHYKKDPKLGRWVATQRRTYKENKVTDKFYGVFIERKHLLNSIGFVWEDSRGPKF